MPPEVFCSSSLRRTTTRSCKGRIFMDFLLQTSVLNTELPGDPRNDAYMATNPADSRPVTSPRPEALGARLEPAVIGYRGRHEIIPTVGRKKISRRGLMQRRRGDRFPGALHPPGGIQPRGLYQYAMRQARAGPCCVASDCASTASAAGDAPGGKDKPNQSRQWQIPAKSAVSRQ